VLWAKRVLGITVQIAHRRDGGLRHTWARADDPIPRRAALRGGAASMGGRADVWLAGPLAATVQRLRVSDRYLGKRDLPRDVADPGPPDRQGNNLTFPNVL